MDVQAAAPTLATTTFTLPPPASSTAAPTGSDPAATAASSPGTSAGAVPAPASSTGSGATADPTPGLALLPPHGGGASANGNSSGSLPANVANLYGAPAQTTSVSFQPAAGSNEIVTVVTNTQTGKVVVQFPAETLVALAQFFQKLDSGSADNGAVVDKKV